MADNRTSAYTTLFFLYEYFIKKAPFKFLIECMLSVVKGMLTVINAVWLLEYLTNLILNEMGFAEALKVLCIVAGINIVTGAAQNFYNYCVKPQSDLNIKQSLEKRLMLQADGFPSSYYENSKFYATISQAEKAVSSTAFSAYSDFIRIIGDCAQLLSAIVAVIAINPILTVFIVFTFPMVVISKKYGQLFSQKKMALIFGERKKQYARNAWISKESVRAFATTNAARIVDRHYDEAHEEAIALHSSYGQQLFGWDLMRSGFSITLIMISCYAYGMVASVFSEGFSISGFSVMFVAIMNMISRVRRIYQAYENACGYGIQLKAIKDFEQFPHEEIHSAGIVPGKFESLEFRNVWFTYDDKNWVIKDVSFMIKAGEKASLLGYNGAGKSTMIKLILRFYDVSRGEILYNGVNIKQYRLEEYRKKFSAAFQDSQLFAVSLAENILVNKYREDQEQSINEVLEEMNQQELIDCKHQVLGREYEKDGLVLSGGQQQRIVMARLHFTDFEIALLDEASAALDPISARQMQDDMFRLVGDRTMIMVSHDMSVTKSVTRILFLADGELEACGTHEELMQHSIKYAEFYRCQAKDYEVR